ncbi:MAG: PadR family transcriptional regulator [Candidatus Thorarchaeota archaeon]|nr:PadR family transcriptional regulator [Candidatus Thorarchaeota archaeon]
MGGVVELKNTDSTHNDLMKPHIMPRGLLHLIVMSLLKNDELSGSEIMNTLGKKTEERWRPSPGSIYPILDTMLNEGFIELARIVGKNKKYSLTTKGEKRMLKMLKHRPELEDRAQLGMVLWFQFLDPDEQVQIHASMLMAPLHFLKETISNVSDAQKKELLRELNAAKKELDDITSTLSNDFSEE